MTMTKNDSVSVTQNSFIALQNFVVVISIDILWKYVNLYALSKAKANLVAIYY